MIVNISLVLDAAMGGGCGDRPRCESILATVTGSLIALIIFSGPLQCLHFETSTSNVRTRRFAHRWDKIEKRDNNNLAISNTKSLQRILWCKPLT